jgi:hypothetical protein
VFLASLAVQSSRADRFSSWRRRWTPTLEEQAIGHIWRIGQMQAVAAKKNCERIVVGGSRMRPLAS